MTEEIDLLLRVKEWFDNLIDNGIKCVAFDFDKTLINIHTGHQISAGSHDILRTLSWDSTRKLELIPLEFPVSIEYFSIPIRDLVNLLIKLYTNGIKIAITSFGHAFLIKAYLNTLPYDLSLMFNSNNIITPSKFVISRGSFVLKESCIDPECVPILDFSETLGDKNPMLHLLEEQYHFSPDQIVLFDDSIRNITNARREGFRAVHTPDGFKLQTL